MSAEALSAIEAALEGARDADDGLRETVRILSAEPGIGWAGIAFEEESALVLGPSAGRSDESRRRKVTVRYKQKPVGELWVDGDAEAAFLEAVAEQIAEHVLLGWDTGGEAWEP